MANSLIPYSFVPGTKAMASEVNANFVALANAVEEAKEFTSESIQQFNEDMEERLEQSLGNKLDTNLYNSLNITNSVMELPETMKVELNNGVLILKAGSVVIVPDGFESDGITPKFEYVTIENDLSISSSGLTGNYTTGTVFYNATTKSLGYIRLAETEVYSCPTVPLILSLHGYWYDTTSNWIRYYVDYTVKWTNDRYSFPICQITNEGSTITGINRINNGLGFVGSTFWVDKGVKFFIPSGKDTNGNYLNTEYVSDRLQLRTFDTTVTMYNAKLLWGPEEIFIANGTVVYSQAENYNKYAGKSRNSAIIATFDIVQGIISNLKVKNVFQFVDTSENILEYAKFCQLAPTTQTSAKPTSPSVVFTNYKSTVNWYRVWSDGWIEQGGRGGGEFSRTFLKPFSDTNYTILVVPLSSDGSNDNCMVKSVSATGFSAYIETNNSGFWYACGY